jgi:hypothetical protein
MGAGWPLGAYGSISKANAKKWAKMTDIRANPENPNAPPITTGDYILAKAIVFCTDWLDGNKYRVRSAYINGATVIVPYASEPLAVAMSTQIGSIVKTNADKVWVASGTPDTTMTLLAFVCFKIHNRLTDFLTDPLHVKPDKVGVAHDSGIAAMKATLIAECTKEWGVDGDWPSVGLNIVRKN